MFAVYAKAGERIGLEGFGRGGWCLWRAARRDLILVK